MLVWLNLVLTDQQLPPCPSGKFLRFLFCLQERLVSDSRSMRCMSLGFPSPPGLLSACHPTAASPQPCSSLVPLLRPHKTTSTSPQSSSGSPSSPWPPPLLTSAARVTLAAVPVGAGGFCTFWDLEQACLGVPMSWELSTWRRIVVLHGESLGWAQGTSQNVRRDHLA